MIKIGVFGLSGKAIDLIRKIQRKTKNTQILFFTHDMPSDYSPQEHNLFSSTDPVDLISRSDRVIFSDPSSGDMPFIRHALCESTPLFFINTGNLTPENMNEIVRLSGEAETPAVCFNPIWTHFTSGKIPVVVSNPFYAEMIYSLPPLQFKTEKALDHLLFSLESILRIFHAFPKKPVVNIYSSSLVRTDMIHVRLDFDNRAMALFRYEGLSQSREYYFRLIQSGHLIKYDFKAGEVHHSLIKPEGLYDAGSALLPDNNHSLFRSWQFLLSEEKEKNIFMEDRLTTTRIQQYIRDKVRHNSLMPRHAVKNLQ